MIESLSKKLRLEGRDYSSPGWYFVTLGADFHKHLFGHMEEAKVVLNDWGRLVVNAWNDLPNHGGDLRLGEFIVMPNHVHGLIRLGSENTLPLGTIINGFKGQVTRNATKSAGRRCTVWQQNYHEVIVHGLDELKAKAAYIKENPVRWAVKHVPRGVINPLPGQSTPKGEPPAGAGQTLSPMQYVGNVDLMKVVPKLALRVSRRASEGEIEALKAMMRQAEGVVVSTFFSPGERACLDVLLEEGNVARVLWVIPMAMPEKIFAQWAGAFVEGRALWLSRYPRQGEADPSPLPGQSTPEGEADPSPLPGQSTPEGEADPGPSRERCMECNAWVETLANPLPGQSTPKGEVAPSTFARAKHAQGRGSP